MQRTSLAALLLSASLVAAPAIAQITVIPMPPAPQPFAVGPPLATGIPQTPLTAVDAAFLQAQLDGGMAEIRLAQLALQKSQDQNVRNFAQKMITDHMAANAMMMQIADAYNVHASAALAPQAQALYDNLSTLDGVAFDTVYIDGMIRAHDAVIEELDTQQTKGQNPQINVWVQNTRPVVVQHEGIAQQIKANLPRSG